MVLANERKRARHAAERKRLQIIGSLRSVVTHTCNANSAWAVKHTAHDLLSCFDSAEPPPVSPANYMIQVESAAGPDFWPQCLILIDQLSRATGVPVSVVNVHRLLLTAYCIVLKMCLDDTGVTSRMAKAGGVDVAELAEMECIFLNVLDWRVAVGSAAYKKLCRGLFRIQEAARSAAEGTSLDGPIAVIPESVVPLHIRFSLKVCAEDTAFCGQDSVCSEDQPPAMMPEHPGSLTNPVAAFVPSPPTAANSGGGRPQSGSPRAPEGAPAPEQPRAVPPRPQTCFAGRRIVAARSYGRSPSAPEQSIAAGAAQRHVTVRYRPAHVTFDV
eukprot:TRINITY_DN24322_c0_g1_i1.p1 TRINITY_DN24322_c0_g1~~TRINITY_DN24322_c0_g1_i1.p1  ORF type:complete len:355 (+),score=64.77 TRINITY_DN24322_c0_g1_i1:80-1066(+)